MIWGRVGTGESEGDGEFPDLFYLLTSWDSFLMFSSTIWYLPYFPHFPFPLLPILSLSSTLALVWPPLLLMLRLYQLHLFEIYFHIQGSKQQQKPTKILCCSSSLSPTPIPQNDHESFGKRAYGRSGFIFQKMEVEPPWMESMGRVSTINLII